MANPNIVELNANNFADFINGDTPILVDFWAPWCGPCRAVAPTLDEIAAEREGAVLIGKLNVDENQPLAVQHNVRGIPTFILFQNGEVIDRLTGAMPKQAFDRLLDQNAPNAVA